MEFKNQFKKKWKERKEKKKNKEKEYEEKVGSLDFGSQLLSKMENELKLHPWFQWNYNQDTFCYF